MILPFEDPPQQPMQIIVKLRVDPPPLSTTSICYERFYGLQSCLPCGNNIVYYACVLRQTFGYTKCMLLKINVTTTR